MIGDTRMGEAEVGPVWSSDESTIYFISTSHGATALNEVSLDGELTVLYENDNHLFSFSYHQEQEDFVKGISTPTDPCNFYHLHKNGTFRQLTEANKEILAEVELSEPEEITFTAEDGWEIQGWLLRPYGFKKVKNIRLF